MSGNSGSFFFSYTPKNSVSQIRFEVNKRRQERLENSSSAQPVNPTPKGSAPSSLPVISCPIQSTNDAYMRRNDSIPVSPGGRDTLQAGRHVADDLLASPPAESVEAIYKDCMNRLQNGGFQFKDKDLQTSRGLSYLFQEYQETSRRLLSAETELKEWRRIATSALVDVKGSEKQLSDNLCAEMASQLAMLVQENDRLQVDLTSAKAEADRLKGTFDLHKTRFAELSESYRIGFCYAHPRFLSFCFIYRLAVVGSGLDELAQAQDTSRQQQLVRMEFEESKRQVASGLKALRPILNNNETLARSKEMMALIKDLKESLLSSHQVTDMLRAKIAHQASQLVDAQARVKELEEQSLAKLFITAEENKQQINLLVDTGRKLDEVAAKLIVREKEAVEALLASASLETNIDALSKEIEAYKATCAAHVTEREDRAQEIAALKADLEALKESKEDLRVLLAEAKKSEIRARDANIELQLKMEEEVGSLKSQLKQAEEKKSTSLADWLAQEHELNKRLNESEGVGIALRVSNEKLQADLLSIRAELATLVVEHQGCRKELLKATDDVSKLQECLDTQSIDLSWSKEDFNELNLEYRKLEVEMEERGRALQVQEMKASIAESLLWAKDRLESVDAHHYTKYK